MTQLVVACEAENGRAPGNSSSVGAQALWRLRTRIRECLAKQGVRT